MDADEREIYQFLKSWGGNFVSAREVCRRAGGKRRYNQDPEWAKPVLLRMEERGILESNSTGQFRIRPLPKTDGKKRWISPDIAKILSESGVEPDEETGVLGEDDQSEPL
jgi:hypothetical protein